MTVRRVINHPLYGTMLTPTDEEMPDVPEQSEEPATEETTAVDQPAPKQPDLKEEVNVSGGRRRGKRQVMKKKTVRDDEGYLGELSIHFYLISRVYLTIDQ